jgi:hypothetical protein
VVQRCCVGNAWDVVASIHGDGCQGELSQDACKESLTSKTGNKIESEL